MSKPTCRANLPEELMAEGTAPCKKGDQDHTEDGKRGGHVVMMGSHTPADWELHWGGVVLRDPEQIHLPWRTEKRNKIRWDQRETNQKRLLILGKKLRRWVGEARHGGTGPQEETVMRSTRCCIQTTELYV